MMQNGKPASRSTVLDVRVVTGTGGGPEKTILNSPRFLRTSPYRMLCAYLHPPDDPGFQTIVARAAELNAPLYSIPDRGPLDWGVIPRLLEICRRERVRIWHGHDYKSNFLGLALRSFWRMRLISTVHGWVQQTRRTPLYYWIDRLCLPRLERVICVSDDLHASCRAAGVSAQRCILLENGIDTEWYRRRRTTAEAKKNLGLDPQTFLVGGVGRLSAEKGFANLIRAVHLLLNEGKDLALVILGDGDERAELEHLIANLGRQDRIRLLGHQPDPQAWYEAMDVFALSSLREGLPNVLLEAMSLEVPVLATAVAGVPLLVKDGINGLLVQADDISALHQGLRRYIDDPELRGRMAWAGRDEVVANYSFARRMDKLKEIYDRLLAGYTAKPGRQELCATA